MSQTTGRRQRPGGARRVQSVLHAVNVLEELAAAAAPLGVSELARRTGLSKATIFHLVTTLESRNLVTQESAGNRYGLGWGLYALGSTVARDSSLTQAVRGRLEGLAERTGETVLVGILDGQSVLYLDRAESPSGLRMVADVGRRSPLHATASGKILLAHQPRVRWPSLVEQPLRRFSPTTVVDASTLFDELERVRDQGFARSWQEHEPGVSSIGVPLRDYTGEVIAALTIAGPATRLTARALRRQLGPLREAAHDIEHHLGGAGQSTAPRIEGEA